MQGNIEVCYYPLKSYFNLGEPYLGVYETEFFVSV